MILLYDKNDDKACYCENQVMILRLIFSQAAQNIANLSFA